MKLHQLLLSALILPWIACINAQDSNASYISDSIDESSKVGSLQGLPDENLYERSLLGGKRFRPPKDEDEYEDEFEEEDEDDDEVVFFAGGARSVCGKRICFRRRCCPGSVCKGVAKRCVLIPDEEDEEVETPIDEGAAVPAVSTLAEPESTPTDPSVVPSLPSLTSMPSSNFTTCQDSTQIEPQDGKFSIKISPPSELNTLTLKTTIGTKETIAPLGRSYDGYDWEAVAGPYNIAFQCDGTKCDGDAPVIDPSNQVFVLTTFVSCEGATSSFRDEASRFLEQTTFGPTTETISTLSDGVSSEEDLNTNIKQWIRNEMDPVPATSHREHFRSKSTTRFLSTIRAGNPLHACAAKTRWHSYTFTNHDKNKFVKVSKSSDGTKYVLLVDGIPRTEVADRPKVEGVGLLRPGKSYKMCMRNRYVNPSVGSVIKLDVGGKCGNLEGGNPPIRFTSANPQTPPNTMTLSPNRMSEFLPMPRDFENDDFYHDTGLNVDLCDFLHVGAYPVYLDFTDGNWLALDPRLNLQENTLENVIPDGGGSQELIGAKCANVPQNFMNMDSCVLSKEAETCSPNFNYPDAEVPLTEDSIVKLQDLTNSCIYAVKGLIPKNTPCKADRLSRWELVDNTSCSTLTALTDIDAGTKNTLANYLRAVEGDSIRDLVFPSDNTERCVGWRTTPSVDKDVAIDFDSMCWKLVHPHHKNVYDFTAWVDMHPGGPDSITQFASRGEVFLHFPHSDSQTRWWQNLEHLSLLGTLGETMLYQDLPLTLQLESVSKEYGAEGQSTTSESRLVCGSPYEVKNDHTFSQNRYNMRLEQGGDERIVWDYYGQKQTIWTTLVLSAPDQLRQKMAWALYQILAISPGQIKDYGQTEFQLVYYDIFVRHAFGNYIDILKEVSYSPAMGKMLSYHRNKSAAYNWERFRKVNHADENYAREIMQLFSIGTVMLEMDGTPKKDPVTDTPILTYTNEHIMSFARAWTGFEFQRVRGNVEIYSKGEANLIDPMLILPQWRDVFPKINLLGGYIGDGYPLCVDLPNKTFLRKGAKYRLLGSSSHLELHINAPPEIETSAKSLQLSTTSQLYNKLCKPSSIGGTDCNWENEVALDEHIDCDGKECVVDTLQLVQVTDTIFYEYVQPPCVRMSFYDNAKKISNEPRLRKWKHGMCADPRLIDASEACIEPSALFAEAFNCEFVGERMKYDTATQRCAAIGQQTGSFKGISNCESICCTWKDRENYFWHDASCHIKVKVDESGYTALIHSPDGTADDIIADHLHTDTFNFFPAYWSSDSFPAPSNQCGNGVCEAADEGCICNTKAEESAAFTSMPVSVDEVLTQLHIGSFSPDIFDLGTYNDPIDNGVIRAYLSSSGSYDMNTIFEVEVLNKKKYFRNVRSSVAIMDMSGQKTSFSFRNAPQFMSMAEPNARDAQYETDAVLDDYFYHPNTAPFLAKYFIQRFGISNPSPRYVKTVALAFINGSYDGFGSGKYGDLAALLAAVLLDREARSSVVVFDPTYGSLREPLLKFIGYMRAMKYESFDDSPTIIMKKVSDKIGQMAHEIETVFSFFEFDFSPVGPVQNGKLVAPEGQRYQTPTIVGLMNGLYSLTKYGLTECFGGLSKRTGGCNRLTDGKFSAARGNLTYNPNDPADANAVVDELATLLTAGRLNPESRRIITEEYSKQTDSESGLRIAQQLVLSSPEFHSTNMVQFSGEKRAVPEPPAPTTRPYKHVTYLFLNGGVDSFNILVPHSGCTGKDMYAEYNTVRGEVALPKAQLLPISTTGQVCSTFGIHPSLPILKSLYDAGDVLFFANTGVLFEPVTKEDWNIKTQTQLFAHNVQQRDTMQVDAFQKVAGTGILGRMADSLTKLGFNTGSFSVSHQRRALINEAGKSPSIYSVGTEGVTPFNQKPTTDYMASSIADVNNITTSESGFFAKTWSELFDEARIQTDTVLGALSGVEPSVVFPDSKFGDQLKMVTQVTQARDKLNMDRQFFVAEMGGFDSHLNTDETLLEKFPVINDAIEKYAEEMKALGVWDNTILILASDFGRTLYPNSGEGTDHAWGGNYFMIGGGLKGGRVLGKYPDSLQRSGSQILKLGRVIPTTSWDSIMNGVAQWLGVGSNEYLNEVLPNRMNFNDLFQSSDLFN